MSLKGGNMDNIALIIFGIFLSALIILDISLIISLLRTGDERRQLIVWKTSAFTLLVVMGTLIIDVIRSLINAEAMLINPFIKLSITAMIYFLSIQYYKKRYGG